MRARRDVPADPGRRTRRGLRSGARPADADRSAPTDPRADVACSSPRIVIPVPCNPDCLAMAYALKLDGTIVPLTRLRSTRRSLIAGRAQHDRRTSSDHGAARRMCSSCSRPTTRRSRRRCALSRSALLPAEPYRRRRIELPQRVPRADHAVHRRALVRSCARSRRSCVHIAHPDGRMIPFDTFNLFYRDGRTAKLDELRARAARSYP